MIVAIAMGTACWHASSLLGERQGALLPVYRPAAGLACAVVVIILYALSNVNIYIYIYIYICISREEHVDQTRKRAAI